MKPDDTEYEIYEGKLSELTIHGGFMERGSATGKGYQTWVDGSAKEDIYLVAIDEHFYGGSDSGGGFKEGGMMAYEK